MNNTNLSEGMLQLVDRWHNTAHLDSKTTERAKLYEDTTDLSAGMLQLVDRWYNAAHLDFKTIEPVKLYEDTTEKVDAFNTLCREQSEISKEKVAKLCIDMIQKIYSYDTQKSEHLAECVAHNTSYETDSSTELNGAYNPFHHLLFSVVAAAKRCPDFLTPISDNQEDYDTIINRILGLVNLEHIDSAALNYNELNKKILSRLELKDLLAIHQTKQDRKIVNDELAHRLNIGKITLQDLGIKKDSTCGKKIEKFFGKEGCSKILSLDLSNTPLNDFSFLENFPNLQSLNLKDCLENFDFSCKENRNDFKSTGIDKYLKNCTNLQDLNLDNSNLNFYDLDFLLQFPKLQRLNLTSCTVDLKIILKLRTHSDNSRMMANEMLVNGINREEFKLDVDITINHYNEYTSVKDIIDFFGESSSKIERLDLKEIIDLKSLLHFPNLRSLSLIGNQDLSPLMHFTNLQMLMLSAPMGTHNLSPLQHCSNLKTLTLLGNHDLSPLQHFTKLSELSLKGNHDLSSLQNAPPPKLKILRIFGNQMTNADFLQRCFKLYYLSFKNCKQLINLSSLQHCLKLEDLQIENCEQLTDLSSLPLCRKLVNLNIENCNNLIDVRPLLLCLKLICCTIKNCEKLTDLSPLKSHPKLKYFLGL
jgi:hypothetical protein